MVLRKVLRVLFLAAIAGAAQAELFTATVSSTTISANLNDFVEVDASKRRGEWTTTFISRTERFVGMIDCLEMTVDAEEVGHRAVRTAGTSGRSLLYPMLSSPEGQLMVAVCGASMTSRLQALGSIEQSAICSQHGGSAPNAMLCREPQKAREAFALLATRMAQHQKVCRVDANQWETFRASRLFAGAACRTELNDCLKTFMLGVDMEIRPPRTAPSCDYLPRWYRTFQEDADRGEAKSTFVRCAKERLPGLDDRITPADVVARAIVAACRPAPVKQGFDFDLESFLRGAERDLVSMVLEQRTSAQPAPAASAPRSARSR